MAWLSKWKAPRGSPAKTHALLDGGILEVPPEKHGLFLNEYANAIARSEKVHVVEFVTPVFRLFADLDFKEHPSEIVDAAIKSACGVAAYYFDVTSNATVLRKDLGGGGVHLVWTDIFVTAPTALSFRNHLVGKLQDACAEVDWATVVDAAVYKSSLRMPWSSKTTAPGVYVPSQVCAPDGTLADVPKPTTAADYRAWMRKTSIRAPDASPTPSCIVTSEPEVEKSDQKVVPLPVLPELESLVLPTEYGRVKFTGLHTFGDHAAVLRTDCTRCANKNFRHHRSSTVYFVILKRGVMYQRCYCRKEVLREGGVACADFVGAHLSVPKKVLDALWPPPPPGVSEMLAMFEKTRPPLKKRRKKAP